MGTTLDESARWAGAHRWVENRLFQIAGSWVPTTADVDAKLTLDRHSHHHAWRAAQWWDRLPVLADVDRDALCEPPDEGWRRMLERLTEMDEPTARLAGLYRVALPRLFGAYAVHRRAADDLADGAIIRTLVMVQADVTTDWQEGELLLQGRLADGAGVDAAAESIRLLEASLAGR